MARCRRKSESASLLTSHQPGSRCYMQVSADGLPVGRLPYKGRNRRPLPVDRDCRRAAVDDQDFTLAAMAQIGNAKARVRRGRTRNLLLALHGLEVAAEQ